MSAVGRGVIFFLTGPPGVGKSTVARALANQFERSIYFDIDLMRLRVVKGLSLPLPGNFGEETRKQFDLAHVATGQAAKIYSDAGFAVIADHSSHKTYIDSFISHAGPTRVVALTADIETNLQRNSLRTSPSFDYSGLEYVIPMLSESFVTEHTEAGYQVIDTTNITVEQAVSQIVEAGK